MYPIAHAHSSPQPGVERADDIKAGLEYLQDHKEIDEHRLGLLGISEGGNIGPMITAAAPTVRDRDANVPVEHARLLAEAIRAGGNADVTVRILPNYNHLFLKDTDGRFTDKRYWNLN